MNTFHPLKISNITRETRDAVVLTFDVPENLREQFLYTQGQHLTLRTHINNEEVRRSYSICSSVQDKQLRVAIKKISGGLFSEWANSQIIVGDAIDVLPPTGHFNIALSPENKKHYAAFAAGSGITPILSIIKTTLQTEPQSRFTLVYGNRASSTIMFKEALEDLKDTYLQRFNLVFVMSREQQDIPLFNGRIDRAKCDALVEHWLDASSIDVAFTCGPEEMMHNVSASLQAHGLDKQQIKMELFVAGIPSLNRVAPVHHVVGQAACQVTVIQDGRSRTFGMDKNKQSVLDAALAQGIELPYSCKGGICSTCRAKLIEGEVDMDNNFALEDYEVARGFVLCCQSFPVTDNVTVDFDQET
jgi:ring-1,2-phenylacetyl-CoA epoxidase subunit PaaE